MSCRVVFASLLLTIAPSAAVWAEDPVEFDARTSFPCREVKAPDQADAARKVIVAVIPITATFNAREDSIETIRYELKMPQPLTVIDHLPKTQGGSNVVGTIHEQRGENQHTDLNVKFGGQANVGFNLFGAGFSLGGEGGQQTREVNEVQTGIQVNRLPPKNWYIVAGTKSRGQTLYFDLKWHDQTTRAGQTEYAILAEVPKEWTGDCFTLACTAQKDGGVAVQKSLVIGLYMTGDTAARKRIEEKARTARPAGTSEDLKLITNSIGMKLRLIPAGRFEMGSADNDKDTDADERPRHWVTITRPFYMGACEVTQGQYKEVMGVNPSWFSAAGDGKDMVQGLETDRFPVEQVSWLDAVKYCNALSKKESLKPFYQIDGDRVTVPDWNGEGYRLPTEAEWEYACRAGTKTKYWFGDDDNELGRHAWFDGNSQRRTHPVGGSSTENPFGLYDMHGNVWEWCWDWHGSDYYNSPSSSTDSTGPETGTGRVLRGGSGSYNAGNLRSANRDGDAPGGPLRQLGPPSRQDLPLNRSSRPQNRNLRP